MDMLKIHENIDLIFKDYLYPVRDILQKLPPQCGHHELEIVDDMVIRFIFDESLYHMVGFHVALVNKNGNRERIPFEDLPSHKLLDLAPTALKFVKSIAEKYTTV